MKDDKILLVIIVVSVLFFSYVSILTIVRFQVVKVALSQPTMTPEITCEGGIFTVTNIPRDQVVQQFNNMIAMKFTDHPHTRDLSDLNHENGGPKPTKILDGNLSGMWCVGEALHMSNTKWDANGHVDVGPDTN